MRTGRQQQLVVCAAAAVGQRHCLTRGIDFVDPLLHDLYVERREMLFRVTQVGAGLVDVINQVIGNCHTRVWWFRLVSDDGDIRVRIGLAQGFGGNNAGRACTND